MKEKSSKENNKKSIILIVLIIIVGILIVLKIFSLTGLFNRNKIGNTIGNINNFGYIAEDNKYIYYMCPNENGQYVGISKVSKKDLTSKQERLIEGTWEITGINSYGDYIYFITLVKNEADKNGAVQDEVDNKIHRIRKDGKKHEVINDNQFNNYNYKIVVVDKKVYYIGEDECIWYMDLNGKHKTRLNENASGFEAVTEKYILYNMVETKEDSTTTVSYIMDRDGKNSRKINGERLYTPIINGDFIYYITAERYLHRVKIDGTDDKMLSSNNVYNLNVTDNGIFYMSYYHDHEGNVLGVAIYKSDLDGNNTKQLYKLEESSTSLCVLNDWIYYLDSNDEQGRMEILSLDGKQRIVLNSLDYKDYYYLDDLEKENNNEGETGEIENTNTAETQPEE